MYKYNKNIRKPINIFTNMVNIFTTFIHNKNRILINDVIQMNKK